MLDRRMSFDDTFREIRGGDIGVIAGFALECLIMLSPLAIFAVIYFSTP